MHIFRYVARSVRWKGLLTWYITLRSLKGRCHGNQLKSQNRRFWRTNIVALPFRNGLKYLNSDFKSLNFSELCKILVTFGPVTPEFTLLTLTPFTAIQQKSAYHAKYVRISSTYLNLLYRFGRRIGGDDYPYSFGGRPRDIAIATS